MAPVIQTTNLFSLRSEVWQFHMVREQNNFIFIEKNYKSSN